MQATGNVVRRPIRSTLIVAFLAVTALVAGLAPAEAAGREAITLWWVIFNNPEACTGECDDPDLLDPAVEASVVYATGALVKTRADGKARLVASIYEQQPGFVDEVIGGPGLLDAEKAEIHMVSRSHGRRIAAIDLEQITRFVDSGCEEAGGPNLCEDIQFAVHPPGEIASPSPVFWFPHIFGGARVPGAASYMFRDSTGVRVVFETRIK